MLKKLQIIVALIGLIAAIVYILYFFRVIYHPYIPTIAGGTVIFSYLFGVYAKKKQEEG
ncbi:hypothetical protein [Cyclobacterium marinum]|uniref:Uncharacterized protein n=1 Tax=Cyclobacterium marinum (strain ATCC 25205 / DSM 745 / LMG 13164 / NCIMB 1802) TaxID=880070 RepID=G0J800_CYCMS|nr:hypothetical protein [Cyclobacterium marinum]AEL28669.1 hypothetical protein Cycma_4985 [Cyclobacterium marinum DSM 745]MBI0398511.1 hypothetical protein [Cyclobacterium marinum]MBR9777407.1 hypothetical protein [Cytophagales bacterium]